MARKIPCADRERGRDGCLYLKPPRQALPRLLAALTYRLKQPKILFIIYFSRPFPGDITSFTPPCFPPSPSPFRPSPSRPLLIGAVSLSSTTAAATALLLVPRPDRLEEEVNPELRAVFEGAAGERPGVPAQGWGLSPHLAFVVGRIDDLNSTGMYLGVCTMKSAEPPYYLIRLDQRT